MKPDKEPLFSHSSLVCKHDSKPFEYNNSAFDTAGLEEIMKENQNVVLCDLNNCKNDAAPLASEINDKDGFWSTQDLECTMVVEDVTDGNENESRDSVAPCTIPSGKRDLFERNLYTDRNGNEKEVTDANEFRDSVTPCTLPSGNMELFEKNTDLHTDKNVRQCELPELIVCCEENAYHFVKDICIDEGVPFKDKIFIESENDKNLCTILPSDENKNGGMTKEREEIELLSRDGSKSSLENDQNEDDAHECGTIENVDIELLIADRSKSSLENHFEDDIGNDGGSLALVQTGEASYKLTNKIVDDVSREKFEMSSMPLLQKFSKLKSLESLLESPESDGNEVEQQSGQISCSEAQCESATTISAAEESNKSSPVNDLSYNSKVESATITFDFNSSKSSASSSRDENRDDIDHEQPLKIDSEPRHGDGISDSLTVGSEVQHGPGESSFSMAGPVSGLITYSGPMANSGSVSLRSDSSATSTRSFAFPVLQAEWNSSPVRMSKADRRHYQKRRSWRQRLLCCRF